MKHLFIVNPICAKVKGKVEAVIAEIKAVTARYPHLDYDIHVTRWRRDALGFCRRYIINARNETVRVHSLGGTGTHFEIVNAIVDLPHVEMALYPMGRTNIFLHYFGLDKTPQFASFENQLFADTIGIDAIRCNHNFGISNVLVGYEAYIDNKGDAFIEKTRLSSDLCYTAVALLNFFKRNLAQPYKFTLDGQILDGEYLSIMIANQPWYSEHMCPGIDARPDDGIFNTYRMIDSPPLNKIRVMPSYLSGKYQKYPKYLFHDSGKKLEISSEKLMWLSVDGETFYGNHIECEILPGAIRFVCPNGILETPKEQHQA